MSNNVKDSVSDGRGRKIGHFVFDLFFAIILTAIIQVLLPYSKDQVFSLPVAAAGFVFLFSVSAFIISRMFVNQSETVPVLVVRAVTVMLSLWIAGQVSIELNVHKEHHSFGNLIGVIAFTPLIGFMEVVRSYLNDPAFIFKDTSYFEYEEIRLQRSSALSLAVFFLSSALVPFGSAYLWVLMYTQPSLAFSLSETLINWLLVAALLQILLGAFTVGRNNLFAAFFLMFSIQVGGLLIAFFGWIGLD